MIVRFIKIIIGGIIGLSLIALGLFLFLGPGTITVFGIILALILIGAGIGILIVYFRSLKKPVDAKTILEEKAIIKYFRSPAGRIKIALTTIGALVLLIAALTVPQISEQSINIYDRGLEGGPDSYFHHIYDPKHLLGPLGHIDLELDNFQRSSGNIILFAAFEAMPSDDPWFTLHVAERWAPGKKLDDRGLVIFVFMKERRIRAEIGYGYEVDLTDVRMKHILEQKMVPLLQEGKPMEAVEAVARELQQRLSHLQGAGEQMSFSDKLPVYLREIKRKAGLAVSIWRAVARTERLILSALAFLLWGWLVWLAVGLVQGLIVFSRRVQKTWQGRDVQEGLGAMIALFHPLLNAIFALVLIFIVLTVGEYFYAGKGLFGGGGVNVFW
jgi:uncharacterized membrane protein YgcG